MSKFLELCEEYDPIQGDSPKWQLIDFLKSKGVNVSLVKDTDMLYIDTGESTIVVNVDEGSGEEPEEEAESIQHGYGDFDVNKEVEDLAGKAQTGVKGMAGKLFGTSAQQAKSAVKKRQGVVKQAVGAYDRKTQKLKNDLRNIR